MPRKISRNCTGLSSTPARTGLFWATTARWARVRCESLSLLLDLGVGGGLVRAAGLVQRFRGCAEEVVVLDSGLGQGGGVGGGDALVAQDQDPAVGGEGVGEGGVGGDGLLEAFDRGG